MSKSGGHLFRAANGANVLVMQKLFLYVLTVGLLIGTYGCGGGETPGMGTDPPPTLPYSISHVYDIGNSNNASDMRVEVLLSSSADIAQWAEVRLVIAKSSVPFTEAQISGLSDANSVVIPLSQETRTVVHPDTAKDADGDTIGNDQPYDLHLAAIGISGAPVLSKATKLTLEDKPVFAGNYLGTWEDLGPPGPGKYPMSMRIDVNYAAQMFYTGNYKPYGRGVQDATATFTVDQGTCTLAVNQFIAKYIGGGQFTNGAGGGCPATQTLSCKIVDEVGIVFDVFNWADCDGTRDARLSYIKQ